MVTAFRPEIARRQPARRRDLPEYRHAACDRLLIRASLAPGTEVETYCDRCRVRVLIVVNCDPLMPLVVMQDVRDA